MRKAHALVVSLLLAGAAAAGAAATLKTVHLGAAVAATKTVRLPDGTIRARRQKLAAFSASLNKAAAAKTPALPPIPHFAPVVVPQVPVVRQVAAAPPPQRPVASVRPKPAPRPQTQPQQQPQVVYVQAPAPQATPQPTGEHEDDGYGHDGHDGGDDGGDD